MIETLVEMPSLPSTVRLLTDPELNHMWQSVPASRKFTPKNCPTCEGEGKIRWYDQGFDGEGVVTYQCNCEDQWQLYALLTHSGIPSQYQRLRWMDLTSIDRQALGIVDSYLGDSRNVRIGRGLYFWGDAGTGKTSLVSMMLKKLVVVEKHDGYMCSFIKFLDTYTAGWRDRDAARWFDRRVRNAGVLVIDDVGKEGGNLKSSGMPETALDQVLRERVANRLPTYITSNDPPEKFAESYDTSQLIQENSMIHELRGANFRIQNEERNRQESEQGLTRPIWWA